MDQATAEIAQPDFAARYAALSADRPEFTAELARAIGDRVLHRHEEMVGRIDRAYRESVPASAGDVDDELLDSLGRIVAAIAGQVGNLEPADRSESLAPLTTLVRRRVPDGLPLETLIRSVQLATRELMTVVGEELAHEHVPVEVVLLVHQFAWDWSSYATEAIVRVHGELDAERSRHDRIRRAEFLRSLLSGQLSPEQIATDGLAHGLDPDRRYHAFRARPRSERELVALTGLITQAGGTDDGPLAELVEGDLVGVAPRPPVVGDEHLLGVGPLVELSRLRESFADATIALETAEAFSLTGTVDLVALGPHTLVRAAERPAAALDAQHLGPLDDQSGGAEIEFTARTLLACDQNVDATAAKLHVHPNTVRYRMNRFREITGLDLRRTADVVVAWWLLNRRAAGRAPIHDRRVGLDRRLTA